MWNTTNDAFAAVLIQPRKVRPVCLSLKVEESTDGSESLPSGEEWPTADYIAIYWNIELEERTRASDIDTDIAVGNRATRLEMTLIESRAFKAPVLLVPANARKSCAV